ncbi:hypothetical protein BY458DRAFT_494586 [Sporodiniella umbellata]|nr:hypothetical protein BY458DRAFT_494586 [Sporodiniella umbellata]
MSNVIFKTITRRIQPTKTLTDHQTITTTITSIVTTTASYTQQAQRPLREWERQVRSNTPLLLVFSLIGLAAIVGLLCYLSFKLCRSGKKRALPLDTEKGKDDMPYDLPWITDTNRHGKTPDMPEVTKHLKPSVHKEEPLLPVHTSLNLVPRSEILNDPARRRGVDEVDLWERKQSVKLQAPPNALWKFPLSRAYPDSPESVKLGSPTQSMHDAISMHPTETETTPCYESMNPSLSKNIQSVPNGLEGKQKQWLQFSGSRSF